jgi:hypothetical protein
MFAILCHYFFVSANSSAAREFANYVAGFRNLKNAVVHDLFWECSFTPPFMPVTNVLMPDTGLVKRSIATSRMIPVGFSLRLYSSSESSAVMICEISYLRSVCAF